VRLLQENDETQSEGSRDGCENTRFARKTGPKLRKGKSRPNMLRKQITVNLRNLEWFTKNEMRNS